MTLLEAWTETKAELDEVDQLEQQVIDLQATNQELTDMNAALAAQLEESNTARTTPGGYVVDAAGDDGAVIDEIIARAEV